MFNLYFGYLAVQLYSVVNVLLNETVSAFALLFSFVVLFVFTFLPIVGFIVGEFVANKIGNASRFSAFSMVAFGVGIGVFENALFYFSIMNPKHDNFSMVMSFCLFAMIPFISLIKARKTKAIHSTT